MTGFLDPKGSVGPGEEDKEEDVIATKTALKESGDYDPPGGRIGAWRDEGTTEALKTVQRRNRIWPDGRMKPGGPTHRVINAEKKERDEGRKPTGLCLSGSVGEGMTNRPADVQKFRKALGQTSHMNAVEATQPGDRFDYPMAAGLRTFQDAYNRKPDAVAHAGGETDTLLARVTGPISAVLEGGMQRNGNSPSASMRHAMTDNGPIAAPSPRPTSSSEKSSEVLDPQGIHAEAQLRNYIKTARKAGLRHGPDYLQHFLDGTGMDRQLTREQARERKPAAQGENRNRGYFERSFTEANGNTANYNRDLLNMKDGDEIKLPADKWEAAFFESDHFRNMDPDEHLATGRSTVVSSALDGFRAVKRGDRIFIFGTVEHEWDDTYDFEDREWHHRLTELHPLTRPINHLGNLARSAQDHGRAKPYVTYSRWVQGLTAELRVVDGKLEPLQFNWRDLDAEAELQ